MPHSHILSVLTFSIEFYGRKTVLLKSVRYVCRVPTCVKHRRMLMRQSHQEGIIEVFLSYQKATFRGFFGVKKHCAATEFCTFV